jgi:hypothetical protein
VNGPDLITNKVLLSQVIEAGYAAGVIKCRSFRLGHLRQQLAL